MRNIFLLLVALFICTRQNNLNAQCSCMETAAEMPRASLLLCDNFQNYNAGSFPINNNQWVLWPGTSTYGRIQATPDNSSNKALFINGASATPDVLLKLGNKNSLRYRLSWRIYIPAGKSASYSILHDENVRTELSWAFHINFGTNGIGSIKVPDYDKEPATYFPYLSGAWNKVMHIVDITNDKVELWVNDEFIDSWRFSLADVGNYYASDFGLGAVNFYPGSTSSEYYVDNVCMWTLGSGTIKPIDPTVVCIKNGTSEKIEYAQGLGLYTVKEFTDEECRDVCDFGELNVDNASNDNFNVQYRITKKSLLPNQILNLDCLEEAFPFATKKQIRGFTRSYTASSEKLYINVIKSDDLDYKDFFIVLYDCENSFCIGKTAAESSFDVVPGNEYKIIVMAIKEVELALDIRVAPCPGQCIVEYGVCESPYNIEVNSSLNSTMPVASFSQKNRLFDVLQKDYAGYERAFRLFVDKEGIVNIRLTSLGLGYCIFLTGNSCGYDLLDASETLSNGGTATISRRLSPGIYHILIDQLYFNPEHTFSLECIFSDPESVSKPSAEICPVLNESPHVVKVRANPLLLDGEPLTLNDRIYLFNPNNISNREADGLNWNGQEVQFVLRADSQADMKDCGYSDGEPIEFKIIRNNKIYYVRPVFQMEGGTEVTASNRFKRSGKSLITGFHSSFNYDDFGVGNFPSISPSAKQFLVEINYQKGWRFERFSSRTPSWIKTTPSAGYGGTDVSFEINANTNTKERRDTLLLINDEGFYKTITLTQPGCTGPSVNAGNDQTYCSNQDISLTATGNGTISWRTTSGNTIASGSRLNTRVTSTQTFMAVATLNGCTATDEVTITVASNLKANAGPDQSICVGAQAILTASGGDSYSWSNGRAGAQIPVSPTQTTTYTVTVSQNGCASTDEVVVNVGRLAVNVSPAQTICAGNSVTLQASGGSTYRWSNLENGSSINVTPTSNQVYGVTVTKDGCSAESSIFVTVLSPPSISVSSTQTICEGQSVLLSARGSGNYTYRWSNNDNRAETTVAPSSTTIYTVSATNGGCTTTANVTVLVRAKPNANAGQDQNICAGAQATLTASGGDIYSWSTGRAGAQIPVSPTQTTTYTVTVSQNGCEATDQVVVNVGRLVANVSPAQTICAGNSVTLQANGGSTYRWSTLENGSSISVKPASSQTYGVTVSNSTGCSTEALISVTVLPIPNVSINPIQPICEGQSVLLVANGSGTFRWSNEATATTAQIRVGPTSSTTYTVTASQNGCSNTASITVLVKSKPLANAGPDKSICQGIFTTLSASGGGTYRWSTGESMANINVSPGSTQNYRLTVTQNGCESTDSVTVTVYRKPIITLTDSRLVFGPTGYLKVDVRDGTPSYRYTWFRNDTAISNQKDLFGLRTGIYKLVATDARGCSATFGPQVIITTSTVNPSISTNIRLFPNPSNGIIHLQFDLDQSTALEVNILDGVGKTIWQQSQRHFFRETLDIDLSKPPAGMYWIQFKAPGGTFYKKLLRL